MIEYALFVKIHPEFPSSCQKFIEGVKVPDGGKGWASGGVVEEGVVKHGEFMEGNEGEGKEGKGFVLLGGWESVDAHMRFRETEVFKENVGYLRGNHGGVEMVSLFFLCGLGRLLMMRYSSMLHLRLLMSSIEVSILYVHSLHSACSNLH